MTVYVDDVEIPFGRMLMSHMFSTDLDELLTMADHIGLARKWIQRPPHASWVHFDVSKALKRRAIDLGAVLVDRFGPMEHVARLGLSDPDPVIRQKSARDLRRVTMHRLRFMPDFFGPLDGTVSM